MKDKKKNSTVETISKADLVELMDKLYEKMRLDFRIDLKREIRSLELSVNFEINRLNDKVGRVEENLNEFKNFVYDKLDWLVGAYKKFETEHDILSDHQKNNNVKLENHETRIKKLEKKTLN